METLLPKMLGRRGVVRLHHRQHTNILRLSGKSQIGCGSLFLRPASRVVGNIYQVRRYEDALQPRSSANRNSLSIADALATAGHPELLPGPLHDLLARTTRQSSKGLARIPLVPHLRWQAHSRAVNSPWLRQAHAQH